ncbi:MAG: hypothetical protein L3J98_07765 [Gammaproteobacteria bacterium]|nr:hypothetical protein [Gammaproteobacteria bacterium]MCF6260045.1 hypothetical protein [Gammaproteobacteria bacterium]
MMYFTYVRLLLNMGEAENAEEYQVRLAIALFWNPSKGEGGLIPHFLPASLRFLM